MTKKQIKDFLESPMWEYHKSKVCDNTDHEGEVKDIQDVEMKEEFEGGIVSWCKSCRERDDDFIKQ